MAEHPRTTSARDHDDSDIIDPAVSGSEPGAVLGRSGHALATDVSTQNDLARDVDDPNAMTRPMKQDDIDADVAHPSTRRD